ncbi:glycosyltransferase family 4 protein [Granulicella tundricola]|uniref:Glycosyl transferase group 1 n=1 Tax=Granulicella tundricola (strain ATCC BAA-1859 / DSM 23138 / MP5ACTX9) TaxID=1198114 RepID=E8X6J8_GRATM|nr:glycosyltransferase family 4 protein [Granulicella tundricola]ADW71148.1 glycosyl transferase group 1 [Granulicella tundricola MP5ACTX9]
MRIVILNDFAHVEGGASQVALSSARALAGRGHQVMLFAGVGPVSPDLEGIEYLEVVCLGQQDILADLNRGRALIRGLWNDSSGSAFREAMRRFDPADTVVHLHTYTKSLSSSVVRAALDCGFRMVLTMHDYFSVCPNGSFFIYPTQTLCPHTPMSAACLGTQCDTRRYAHKLWRVARQWTQEHRGRLPSGLHEFISISDVSERILRTYLPAGARVHRVPNPIAVPHEPPAHPDEHATFSFVGRLSAEKGPQLLAACAAKHNLPVRFIGEGAERAKLLEMLPEAEFTGWLNGVETRKALRASRALVFPSLWYETQGLVVVEAAAQGLPTVVPSESAAREWVEDGLTGLIFRHGDAEDLAEKLLFLRDHPDSAAAMGTAAYQRYWQKPATMEAHCERLEAVYVRMLEQGNGGLR